MNYTQLEINNIIATSGNFTNIVCTTGNIDSTLTIGNTTLTTSDILNIINSTNLYLWSNFR